MSLTKIHVKIIASGGFIVEIVLIPSHHKVKSDYLLIFIAKAKPGNKWSHITHAEKVFSVHSLREPSIH